MCKYLCIMIGCLWGIYSGLNSGVMSSFISSFFLLFILKNLQADFQSGHTNLHFHQEHLKASFLPYSHHWFVVRILDDSC